MYFMNAMSVVEKEEKIVTLKFFFGARQIFIPASSCCACRPDGQNDQHIKMKILWGQDLTPYIIQEFSSLPDFKNLIFNPTNLKNLIMGEDNKHIKKRKYV